MPPRIRAGVRARCTSNRVDGRFFAPLRMTCVAIALGEMSPSCPRPNCHPEEAALPARDSSAARLAKDLLQHRLMPERVLSFAVTWQAARLRLHGQADAARVLKGFRVTGISTSSMTTFWLEFLDFAQNDMCCNNARRDVSVMPSPNMSS